MEMKFTEFKFDKEFKIPGVYQIINIKNNKIYTGSSRNIYVRWRNHLRRLKINKHINILLQNAYNKYGSDCFIFKIIKICEDDIAILLKEEQLYLDLNSDYNILKVAGSNWNTLKDRKLSNSSKIGVCLSEEHKKKLSIAKTGVKFSDEHKAKLSKAKLNIKRTPETILKLKNIAFSIPKDRKPVLQYSISGEFIQRFESIWQAGKSLNKSSITISNCCRNIQKTSHGYIWKFE